MTSSPLHVLQLEEDPMKSDAVCESRDSRVATHESPVGPCGLADAADAPHVPTLSGPELRREVQRSLGATERYLSEREGHARAGRKEALEDSVRGRRLLRLLQAVTGKSPEDVDLATGGHLRRR